MQKIIELMEKRYQSEQTKVIVSACGKGVGLYVDDSKRAAVILKAQPSRTDISYLFMYFDSFLGANNARG